MSRKVLGLEIRESVVTGVLLESSFKGSVIESQASAAIPPDQPADEGGIETALHAVVEALKPTGATCVLGIPTARVSFRNLSVPFHDLKKIRQILPFELEPSLPVPVDELRFDFEAVRRDGHQDLLAFTVSSDVIANYLEILQAVNLRPVVIMPAAYAAVRAMMVAAHANDDFLLVDTGEKTHAVYLVSNGHVRLVRTLPVAPSGNPVVRHLETTLERTFIATRDNLGIEFTPTALVTTGPRAALLAPPEKKPTLMGLTVETMAPVRRFSRLKGDTDTPDWQAGLFDAALALALVETEGLGGVNFSTERSTVQHYWGEYRGQIILTSLLIVLTLAMAFGSQILSVAAKERRLAELDRQIEAVFKSTFPEVTRVQAPLQQMQIRIREAGEAGMGPELPGAKARVIDILNALSQNIPDTVDVAVNRMVVGTDNVVLSGNTDNFNTVDDIKGRLEGADIFEAVTISSADMEKSGQRVRFKLKLDF